MKNKTLTKLFFWLFIASFIPFATGIALTYFQEKGMRERQLVNKVQNLTSNLTQCLTEPMAFFDPQDVSRIAQMVALDPIIVEILAYSDVYEMDLVHIDIPERRKGELFSCKETVFFEGNPIGKIKITASTGHIKKSILSPFFTQICLIILGASFLSFLTLIIVFHKNVVKPMGKLLKQTRKIDEGEMSEAFAWEGNDEFATLGKTVEAMRKKLLFRLQQMHEEARTDALTGIPNRLDFSEKIENVLKQCYQNNQPFSLIMFDLDDFKQVNDTYGHSVGDEVLNIISRLLQNNLRSKDLFARWGGEEFLIAFTNTSKEKSQMLAEKLRQIIAYASYPSGISMTASLGLVQAQYNEPFSVLVERVDKAMYYAKQRGKNQIVFVEKKTINKM